MLALYEAPNTATRMLTIVMGLIDTFTASQRREALIADFDDPRRLDWDIIPRPDRTGLTLHHVDRHQKVLIWDLIRSAVSQRTFTKILGITQLEHVLRDYEGEFLGPALQSWRTSDSYFLTIFGRPGFEDTWMLRFLGHHVCLNITVIDQRWICATPSALGAQPTEYDGVLTPLADDEGLGFEVLESLTSEQRNAATIHHTAPADFVTRQVPQIGAYEYPDIYDLGMPDYTITDLDRAALKLERATPTGVCGVALQSRSQQLLWKLIDCYLDRLPPECGAAHRAATRAAGMGEVHFSWAGASERGRPHYFRVHTDTLLIEAVNSVGGANHLHTVLRDFRNDFGLSLLEHTGQDDRWGRRHLQTRSVSSAAPESALNSIPTGHSDDTR